MLSLVCVSVLSAASNIVIISMREREDVALREWFCRVLCVTSFYLYSGFVF